METLGYIDGSAGLTLLVARIGGFLDDGSVQNVAPEALVCAETAAS